jgi:hypothetical protein
VISDDEETRLAHRSLVAFRDPMPDEVAKLISTYQLAFRARLIASTERAVLARELRELEGNEDVSAGNVLVSLHRRREIHRRLVELDRIISKEGEREETAVVIAETVRASSPIGSRGLTVRSTIEARIAALKDPSFDRAVDEPLPAEYTTRLRAQYRRGRGGT